MLNETTTVVLCGVGGQGTILAADLLARACLGAGFDVKVSEIHGMSQRGGSVTTVVRYGKEVKSMTSDLGSADCIVAFETTEALRNLAQLKQNASMIVNDEAIQPLSVLTGKATMPEHALQDLEAAGALILPATEIAESLGNSKTSNVVLIGALSAQLDIPLEIWEEAVSSRVPNKTIEVNLSALHAGREFVLKRREV